MGVYDDQVLPRLMDKVMDNPAMRKGRAKATAGLRGEVLEIGFGSGLNVPHYPDTVTRVAGVEPSTVATGLARPRIARSTIPVEIVGLDGQRLDQPDEAYDTALSTWTMCTIPDAVAALREVHRVLKPGGTLHFIEHGHAPDEGVARWQQRIEPIHKRLAGGCHLSRRITDLVEDAGFELVDVKHYYVPRTPRPWGYEYVGVARKA